MKQEEKGYDTLLLLSKSSLSKTIKALDRESGSIVLVKKVTPNNYFTEAQITESINSINSFAIKNPLHCFPYYKVNKVGNEYIFQRQFYYKSLKEWIVENEARDKKEERTFIAYQILRAVHELHSQQYYHGDINTNNIMITSYNWVILTDFANFKPTFLGKSDPIFSAYFCNDYQRSCYLAPERFCEDHQIPQKASLASLQSMDLFAVGCVLYELFNGQILFSKGDLLNFKVNPELIDVKLDNLEYVCALVIKSLLELNPEKRLTIDHYLRRDSIFSEGWFSDTTVNGLDSYLYNYFNDLKELSISNQIIQIHYDFHLVDRSNSKVDKKYKSFYRNLIAEIESHQSVEYSQQLLQMWESSVIQMQRMKIPEECNSKLSKFKVYCQQKEKSIEFESYFTPEEIQWLPFFGNLNVCYHLLYLIVQREKRNITKDRVKLNSLLQIKVTQIADQLLNNELKLFPNLMSIFDELSQSLRGSFLLKMFSAPNELFDKYYVTRRLESSIYRLLPDEKKNSHTEVYESSLRKALSLSVNIIDKMITENFRARSIFDSLCASQATLFVPFISHTLQSKNVLGSPQLLLQLVEILEFIVTKLSRLSGEGFNNYYIILDVLNTIMLQNFPIVFKNVANLIYTIIQVEGIQFNSKDAHRFFEVILPNFLDSIQSQIITQNKDLGNTFSNSRFAGDIFAKLLLVIYKSEISNFSISASFLPNQMDSATPKHRLIDKFTDFLNNIVFKAPKDYYQFLMGMLPHYSQLIFAVYGHDHYFITQFIQILFSGAIHIISQCEKEKDDNYSQEMTKSYYIETILMIINQFEEIYHTIKANFQTESIRSNATIIMFTEIVHEKVTVFLFSLLRSPPLSQYIYALILSMFQKYYEFFRFTAFNNNTFNLYSIIFSASEILSRIFKIIKEHFISKTSESTKLQSILIKSISNLILSFISETVTKEKVCSKLIDERIISQLLNQHFRSHIQSISEKTLILYFSKLSPKEVVTTSSSVSTTQTSTIIESQPQVEQKRSIFSPILSTILSPFWGSSSSPAQPRRSTSDSVLANNDNNITGSTGSSSSSTLSSSLPPPLVSKSNIIVHSNSNKIKLNKIVYSNLVAHRINFNHINCDEFQYLIGNFQSVYPANQFGEIAVASIIRKKKNEEVEVETAYQQIKESTSICTSPSVSRLPHSNSSGNSKIAKGNSTETINRSGSGSSIVFNSSTMPSIIPVHSSAGSSNSSESHGGGGSFHGSFNISGFGQKSSTLLCGSLSYNEVSSITSLLARELLPNFKKSSKPLITTAEVDQSKTAFKPSSLENKRSLTTNLFVAHSSKVNKIEVTLNQKYFISCGDDGLVNIWDSKNVGDKKYFLPSQHKSIAKFDYPVTSISYVPSSSSVAILTSMGNLVVQDLEKDNAVLYSEKLNRSPSDEAFTHLESFFKLLYINYYDPSLFVSATTYGRIFLHDLRSKSSNNNNFILNNPSNGAITAMFIDSSKNMIFTGNNYGVYTCWDLRFKLPLMTWQHAKESSPDLKKFNHTRRINNLMKLPNPQNLSQFDFKNNNNNMYPIISTVENEMYLWDVTSTSILGIWRSSPNNDSTIPNYFRNPTSTQNNCSLETFTSILPTDSGIITGGHDCTLRYWDLNDVKKSFFISSPRFDAPIYHSSFHEESIPVFTEYPACDQSLSTEAYANLSSEIVQKARNNKSEQHRIPVNRGNHFSTITSLKLISNPYNNFSVSLLSSSSKGEIKAWSHSLYG